MHPAVPGRRTVHPMCINITFSVSYASIWFKIFSKKSYEKIWRTQDFLYIIADRIAGREGIDITDWLYLLGSTAAFSVKVF